MELRDKILEIRTTRDKKEFAEHFLKHPDQIDPMVQMILDEEAYPFKEYASWILFHLIRSKKFDFQYLYNSLVDHLFISKDQSVLRNVCNCVHELEITTYRESDLVDLLLSFVQDSNNKVALQVYSIKILTKFTLSYPELKEEILQVIALNKEGKTHSYKAANRYFLKNTKKL